MLLMTAEQTTRDITPSLLIQCGGMDQDGKSSARSISVFVHLVYVRKTVGVNMI